MAGAVARRLSAVLLAFVVLGVVAASVALSASTVVVKRTLTVSVTGKFTGKTADNELWAFSSGRSRVELQHGQPDLVGGLDVLAA
jgi:hypothetical protein